MKQTILVTGGAGYIGSHTVLELLQHNYRVVVIDKLCSFQIDHPQVTYFQCDIADSSLIKTICLRYAITGVVHCAAFIEVGASVADPARYYQNNVIKTLQLLDTLRACSIDRLVFSSSAAVYGTPEKVPIPETHPCNPISPYGKTKQMVEQILADYYTAYGMRSMSLRYFNAAGAYPEYHLGERHEPETHLIPRVLEAALNGQRCTIFGNDYPTPDGTCIRDYVHVRDIARAHRLALEYLHDNAVCNALNLGSTTGLSVLEIIDQVQEVTQRTIALDFRPRRAGDPAYLIADTRQAKTVLQWEPEYSDKKAIVSSAYAFKREPIFQNNYQNHFLRDKNWIP